MNTIENTQTKIQTSTDRPILVKSETVELKNATAPGAESWESSNKFMQPATVVTSVDTPMLIKTETVPQQKEEILPPITLTVPKIAVVKKESVPLSEGKKSYNEYTLEVSTDKSRHEVKKRVKDFKDLFAELGKSNPQLEIPESIKQLLSPQKIKESLESVGHNVAAGLSSAGEKVAEVTQPIREISSNAANNVATAGQNVATAGSSVLSAIGQNVQTAGSKIMQDISDGVKQHAAVANLTASNINYDLKEASAGIQAEVNVQKEVVADTAEVAKIDVKAAATDLKNEVWKQAEMAVDNTKQAVSDINAQLTTQVKATAESTKQAVSDINAQVTTQVKATAESTKQAVAEIPFVVSDQVKKTKEERIPKLTQYLQSLIYKPEFGSSPPIKRFLSLDTPPSHINENADWKESDMPWLNQKLAVITGSSSGIGWACTKAMAAKGCHVIMAVRNLEKAHAQLEELKKTMTNPYIEIMHLDLTRPDSIKAFANDFQLKYRHLDILINNAGVMGTPETRTADGVELQMATNHFGHFALTALLLDCLARSENARVVTVASLAHKGAKLDFSDLNAEKKYDRWQQYQQASLANVVFAFELQRKLNEKRIDNIVSVAAHPGFANTHAAQVGPDMEGSWFGKAVASVTTAIAAQSPEMGALPILFAATSCQVKGGDYCGPKNFNHFWGYPTVHFADDNAYDVETAGRMWTAATSTTGIQFDFDSASKSRLNASSFNTSTSTPNLFTGSQTAPLVHT